MQSVKLNLIPGAVLPVVNVSQYDVKRTFQLAVYDGAASYDLTGKTVTIRGTKPDNHGFDYGTSDGVVSVSGNTVTISTTQQMTAVGGHVMAELRIESGTTVIGTLNFIIDVEPSALSEDTIISDTEIPVIERDFEAALAEAEADALVAEGYAKGTQGGTPATSGKPYYHDNAKYYKEQANADRVEAAYNALKAEGFAVGEQNGAPVTSGSPYYHNNAAYYDGTAQTSATNAGNSESAAAGSASAAAADALEAEGFAVGEQNGVPVSSGSPYYQNNAKYYSGLSNPTALANMTDVDISSPSNNQVLKYNSTSQKWENGTGGGGASALDDLTDVDITTPADGNLLQYNGTSQEWENSAKIPNAVSALEETGAVNILPNEATTQTINGGTFTVSDDGTVIINGTFTDRSVLSIYGSSDYAKKKISDKPIPLKAIGANGGSNTTYSMIFHGGHTASDGLLNDIIVNDADGLVTGAYEYWYAYIVVRAGAVLNNVIVKPMLSFDLSKTYSDYKPYAMTNRELTDLINNTTVPTITPNTDYVSSTDFYWEVLRKGNVGILNGYATLKSGTVPQGNVLATIGNVALAGVCEIALIREDKIMPLRVRANGQIIAPMAISFASAISYDIMGTILFN